MLDGRHGTPGKPERLSFVQDNVLKCVEITPGGGNVPKPCPVARVPVYEAIPVIGGQGEFLAIEDRTVSVLRFLPPEMPDSRNDMLGISHAGSSSVSWRSEDGSRPFGREGKSSEPQVLQKANRHLFIDSPGIVGVSVSANGAELAWLQVRPDGRLELKLWRRAIAGVRPVPARASGSGICRRRIIGMCPVQTPVFRGNI